MNKDKIFITVVVPIYNMGNYLVRALESILNQTYKNYEVILVDDGSTDDGALLCDEYAMKYDNIRVIHKENEGLSSARNVGIENSKGEFIIFPDPDDWVDKTYLETFVDLHIEYSADLEICGHYIVNENTSVIANKKGNKSILYKEDAILKLMSSNYFCGFAWNKLYHLDIIKKENLRFDTELGMAQDLHFAFKYLMHCNKIVYNPMPVYYYFQHVGGVTNEKMPLTLRKISGIDTYKKIAEIASREFKPAEFMAYSTIANMSLKFIYIFFDTKNTDVNLLNELSNNLKKYRKYFLSNCEYSFHHKMQGRIAMISPKLYYILRKKLK